MTRRAERPLVLAMILLAAPLAGCLDPDADASRAEIGGPGFEIRETDFYHSYYSDREWHADSFTWESPTGRAFMEIRHTLEKGSERVAIRDANGTLVFAQEFWPGTRQGRFYPDDGAPGVWNVTLERDGAVGQFDVHVWRAPARGDGG